MLKHYRRQLTMSEAVSERDVEAYTKITDNVFSFIMESEDDRLEPVRDILRRITKRDLYVVVDETLLKGGNIYSRVIYI